MLGQIIYSANGRGRMRLEEVNTYGLRVLRVQVDPDSCWAKHRLQKASRFFRRSGVRRVLVPDGFEGWAALEKQGLHRVDPVRFLRAQAAPLTLAALRRRAQEPGRCAVALRGIRVDRDVVNAAEELCLQVRDVCISVVRGGQELSDHLRWEYGAAVCPDHPAVSAAVRFDPRTGEQGVVVLDLFSPQPSLGGGGITLSGINQTETELLPLLAALWEVGKVQKRDLEFT